MFRLVAIVAALLIGGCSSASGSGAQNPAAWPAVEAPYAGALPDYATKSAETESLYRWAATNRTVLQYFQCTCGCESSGHQSIWNCYVQEEQPKDTFVWDPMSAG